MKRGIDGQERARKSGSGEDSWRPLYKPPLWSLSIPLSRAVHRARYQRNIKTAKEQNNFLNLLPFGERIMKLGELIQAIIVARTHVFMTFISRFKQS